jgi:carbonic anhydrase
MRPNKVLAVLQAILSTCFLYVTLASAQGVPAAAEFSYSGDNGPGFWAEINPDWQACGNERQSPVDIRNAVVDKTLKPLVLDLPPTSVTMINDHGHTIKVNYPEFTGGTLRFNDDLYNIAQFHFHTLSEHTFRGNRGLMELHAVFVDGSTPPNYAAIAMLYKIGNTNPFLSQLITAGLPPKSNSEPVPIAGLELANALTETSSYYTYDGSLTIPSCFNVTFIVLKEWATMSKVQFLAFQGILGDNFRPLQALNGRIVSATPGRHR